jgi:hypothetical protein
MKRNKWFVVGVAIGILATVVLAGCSKQGGGSSSGGGGSNSGGSSAKAQRNATPASDFNYDLTKDEQGIVIKKYAGNGGKVIIPATIEDYPVREIGSYAFAEDDSVTEIVVPESVVEIGGRAFYRMRNLTKVTLPDSLTKIPEYLFAGTMNVAGTMKGKVFPEKLVTVNLPASLETIGEVAFANCVELYDLVIPSSLTSVDFDNRSFLGCGKLPIKTRQRLKELGYTGEF